MNLKSVQNKLQQSVKALKLSIKKSENSAVFLSKEIAIFKLLDPSKTKFHNSYKRSIFLGINTKPLKIQGQAFQCLSEKGLYVCLQPM